MVPMCMVTEEMLSQVPEDVRQYLRALRRRIIELEQTDAHQRIAELEAANRKLQAQVDELLVLARQQQEQIRQLQQQVADTRAKLQTNSSNSSLPPSSDRFRAKRRPPRPPTSPAGSAAGNPATRASSGCWSPTTKSGKRSPASPRPAAAVAGL
jgi:TolA-binding protein